MYSIESCAGHSGASAMSEIPSTLTEVGLGDCNLIKEKYDLPWFDLLDVFRNYENPIIIKDCNSYSLKSIINKITLASCFFYSII